MRHVLARNWFLLLLLLAVGLAFLRPGWLHPFTDLWEPRLTMGFSLFLIAFTMPTTTLMAEIRQPYASLWAVLLSYGLVPTVAWLVGLVVPHPDLRIGLILISTVPCTLSSAILWTRMAGGNEATALLTVMGTTFTSWFLTTAWLYALTGTTPRFDVVAVAFDLVVSLLLPVMLAQALRGIPACKRLAERRKVLISALSQLFMLAIITRAAVNVGDRLHAQDAQGAASIFAWGIALSIGLHLFALGSGIVSSRWLGFDRARQIAVGFSASQKTLQVSLVLYEQYYSHYAYAIIPLLFYHVGQLLLDTVIAKRIARQAAPLPEAPALVE